MLLDRNKINISIHNHYKSGLVWSSMVYQLINSNIHYILYIRPLDHYIHIITWELLFYVNFTQFEKLIPLCSISSEKWSSGLVSLLLSNTLDQGRPLTPTDIVCMWSSDLDSITGVWLFH